MRHLTALAAAMAVACSCLARPSGKDTPNRLSELRTALMNAGTMAEQIRLRREICALGPEGHEFLVDGVADSELHMRVVTAARDPEGVGADSFHVCIVDGLKFRFVDVAGGTRRELHDLNERLDQRLLSDEDYLRRFIRAWGPGNGIYREECVDELTAQGSTPVSRRIAHTYLVHHEGLRLDYDPTDPAEAVPAKVRDILQEFKEEHYEGSQWQRKDRRQWIRADGFLRRIEMAVGRERENLLASFEHRTPKSFRSVPSELRFSCVTTGDGHEKAWAKLLDSEKQDLAVIAAKVLWEHHSRKYAGKVMTLASARDAESAEWRKVNALVKAALRPEDIRSELEGGDFAWGAWLARVRPDPSLVPVLIERIEAGPDAASSQTTSTSRKVRAFIERCHKAEAVFALGKSRDRRAVAPLVKLLSSDDYRLPGDAARALGELGECDELAELVTQAAETQLIALVGKKGQWVQRKVCLALAKIGTARALPALEALAVRSPGICDAPGAAQRAVRSIMARKNLADPNP